MGDRRQQFRHNPAVEARVRELHAQGLGRNAIAADLGCGAATITAIAGDIGISFDRATTEQATRAKVADARKARAELILRLYYQAHAALDRLDLPEHDLAQPSAGTLVKWTAKYLPPQDVRALLQASGAAAREAVRLEAVDADTLNLPAVDAWLAAMTEGQAPEDEPGAGPPEEPAPDVDGG